MLLSAVFHEYVMIVALGFFYPVMFLLFGVVGRRWFATVVPKCHANLSSARSLSRATQPKRDLQCSHLAVHSSRRGLSIVSVLHGSLRSQVVCSERQCFFVLASPFAHPLDLEYLVGQDHSSIVHLPDLHRAQGLSPYRSVTFCLSVKK